jgi:hypothetical protein
MPTPRRVAAWLMITLASAAAVGAGVALVVVPDRAAPALTARQAASIPDAAARIGAEDNRTKLRNDMRTSMLQVVSALVLAGGLVFTYRTFRLNRDGQVTDRFAKAVDQIGEPDKADVALGGVYSLDRLARDSRFDRRAVQDVLVAHIRRLAPFPPVAGGLPANTRPDHITPCRERLPTVQAALIVLAGLDAGDRADLRGVDLRGADLAGLDLRRWRLAGAQVAKADLRRADLREADLTGVDLGTAITDQRTRR